MPSSLSPTFRNPLLFGSRLIGGGGSVVTQLIFHVQPDGAVQNEEFTQQPVVWAADAGGSPVASFTGDITISIHSGPAGLLSGTLVIPCVAGVAAYTDLSIDTPGDYTLLATDGTHSVFSDSFTVSGAGIAFISSTEKSVGNSGTTDPISTLGANLIVVNIACYGSGTTTLSDSKSNTWLPLTRSASLVSSQLFYCYAPITDAAQTFSVSGTSIFASVQVVSFRGVGASPFDQENGSTAVSSVTIQPGSIPPSVSGSVIVTGVTFENNGGAPVTLDSGFTAVVTPYVGGFSEGGGLGYLILNSTTPQNPTWNVGTSTPGLAATIANFKPT